LSITARFPSKPPRIRFRESATLQLLQQGELMSKLFATIGLSLILASTAAGAAPATKPADKAAQEKQYCLKFTDDTGSHLTRTECRTKKEWRQLGVDVDDLSSKDGGSSGAA
jgi:hypothetical protein